MDTTQPRLSRKFFEALHYAAELHNNQVRKGGEIPYIGHLLSVAAIVEECSDTVETPKPPGQDRKQHYILDGRRASPSAR